MASKSKTKRKPTGRSFDIEALGLVLLAFGIFLTGLLVPALPTGEIGRGMRGFLTDRVGWGAFFVPPPLVLLGGLFLLRRTPPRWPPVTLGYLVVALGAWAILSLAAPSAGGAWGDALRGVATGAAGVLAYLAAILVVTLGIEIVLGWTPLRIARGALQGSALAVRASFKALLAWRQGARERAAFGADVALARNALRDLDRDLEALRALYPGSAELDRWRGAVATSIAALRSADDTVLADVEADLKAWQSAARDFTRDRAEELKINLKSEGLDDFEGWMKAVKAQLDDPIGGRNAAARALDELRKTIALDLTGLVDRYRRLTRERDLAERSLKGIRARALAEVFAAHGRRGAQYAAVDEARTALEAHADALEPWRELAADVEALTLRHPDAAELGEYVDALAGEVRSRGRETITQIAGWRQAFDEVAERVKNPPIVPADTLLVDDVDDEAYDGAFAEPERTLVAAGAAGGAVVRESRRGDAPFDLGGAAERTLEDLDRAVHVAHGTDEDEADAGDTEDGDTHPDDDAQGVGGIPIQVPPADLLDERAVVDDDPVAQSREVRERVAKINETLQNFKLQGRVLDSVRGPTVTRFEVEPSPGEKISRFSNLSDDLALALAVGSVRIEAPIPGKSVIGLEVPNAARDLISFREAAESPSFRRAKARLPLILGKSIDGEMIVGDLAKMPHLLIAGSTGSGKSVAVNTLIGSLLYKFLPTDLRFLMIDPKMVELTPYDGVPHLLRPVVTNPNDAAGVLLGAVAHMERRYKMMSKIGAKNLDQYNEKARNLDLPEMPFIVIIIDELADLMITSPKEVESAIMRLAQMARATGMHLVLATQRPSVDILTSLIKVNVPARVAFAVSSGHDSRTILDTMGAERLVGMGDMLFYQPGLVKPKRLQGPYISEPEIHKIGDFLRRQYFDDEFVEAYGADFDPPPADESTATGMIDWNDDKLREAAELVINEGQASVSRLQRRLGVGHARAGKLMDSLESMKIVGPHMGSKPREVLVAIEELPDYFGK